MYSESVAIARYRLAAVAVKAAEFTLVAPLGTPVFAALPEIAASAPDPVVAPLLVFLPARDPKTPPRTAARMTIRAMMTPMMIHIFFRDFLGCAKPRDAPAEELAA